VPSRRDTLVKRSRWDIAIHLLLAGIEAVEDAMRLFAFRFWSSPLEKEMVRGTECRGYRRSLAALDLNPHQHIVCPEDTCRSINRVHRQDD
jgi:hypothetical protein